MIKAQQSVQLSVPQQSLSHIYLGMQLFARANYSFARLSVHSEGCETLSTARAPFLDSILTVRFVMFMANSAY